MQTWNIFSGTDVALGLFGAVGFLSVVAVLVSASSSVGKREVKRRERIDAYVASTQANEE